MQSHHAHLARARGPVDEDERERLAAVGVRELVRQHDVSWRVLRQLCAVHIVSDSARMEPALGRAFGEVLEGDVVELLDFLHNELLLVDLDHDRGATCVAAGEPELAQRVLERLGDVDCMRLFRSIVLDIAHVRGVVVTHHDVWVGDKQHKI